MSKYKAILDGLLSTVFKGGDQAEKIAEILNSDEEALNEKDALNLFAEADKARVKELRTKYFDEGHKKGKGEALTPFEKQLRETYQINEDLQGMELIQAAIEANSKKSDKALDEDAIKRSKPYIQLQDTLKKSLEDKDKEWQEKLDAQVKGYQKERTFASVSDKALALFEALNPILSEDPVKASKQKQILINELKAYDFEDQEGKLIVLKDGKVVEDEHGHRVEFDALVKKTAADYFDFKAASQNRDTPNGGGKSDPPKGGNGTKYTGSWPKNEEEYIAVIGNDAVPLAERLALKESWAAKQN